MSGERWQLLRGANVAGPDAGVTFAVWAPRLEALHVRVTSDAGPRLVPMRRGDDGVFTVTVPEVAAGTDYTYRTADEDLADPVSRWQPAGVHGPSRVVDPAAFEWSDQEWGGGALADLVIYELHVGTFTAAGTFEAVIEHLPALRALGVTAIELMPVAQFPGARNWGYDGVLPYAPQDTYGGPEGLRRLVDAAHAAELAVLLDVVYNHLGPEGNRLGTFGPYFTDVYHTPWGDALNFDGPDSDEVRRYFIDNALHWITEYHLDGLRLDAVHAILDRSARPFLRELQETVAAEAERLERTVVVIAESDANDPQLIRPPNAGGWGLDAQWSDDFHHAVHAALTGERAGYYADYGATSHVAKALRDRFVYDGRRSVYRRRRHGAPARDVARERFVVCLQNHDQVGNRATGERLSTLVDAPTQRLAAALLLVSPYVPLLFMGEEYGETNPFLYFVSHSDPDLVEAVRQGRRREFRSFGWRGDVPDPQAEETFRRSCLDRDAATTARHGGIRALYEDLLALRASDPRLRPGAARVTVAADDRRQSLVMCLGEPGAGEPAAQEISLQEASDRNVDLHAYVRGAPDLVLLCNLDDAARTIDVGVDGGTWHLALSTENARYDGAGGTPERTLTAPLLRVPLARRSAALYRREEI